VRETVRLVVLVEVVTEDELDELSVLDAVNVKVKY
jgi:hypothetical protein